MTGESKWDLAMNRPVQQQQPRGATPAQIAKIENLILGMEFGEVTVVVHQGRVFEVKTLKREREDGAR